ncbi:transcription antitermination factor NusB [Porphyromonas pogonae]|uniref:transcription antitermination factor NusB n=1 Tax=Porphyromonas pogonae TaxID=867595 RepID=UPI002E792747|nr:transcription antitermination factor NusB [Porphyromonas pogonae]
MINRALIRTRVLQVVYAHHHRENSTVATAELELNNSFSRTYDLYFYLLSLIPAITELHQELLEVRKNRHLATAEDKNPNTRLVDNRLSRMLYESEALDNRTRDKGLTWRTEETLLRSLLQKIISSEIYERYLNSKDNFQNDQLFWVEVFKNIIATDEDLAEYLEDKSIYWDDELTALEKIDCEEQPDWDEIDNAVQDARRNNRYNAVTLSDSSVEIVKDFTEKTLRRIIEDEPAEAHFLPLFKDREDENFAKVLLRQTLLKHADLKILVEQHLSKNWDSERVADMDMIILEMGISEMLYIPEIPTWVTINECIELAKIYSTPKSHTFVNGILDAVARELKESGRIIKQ